MRIAHAEPYRRIAVLARPVHRAGRSDCAGSSTSTRTPCSKTASAARSRLAAGCSRRWAPATSPMSATNIESIVGFFVDDPRFAGSVVRSLEAMWENARGAREAMSSEMWESINATHSALDGGRGRSVFAQHGFLGWVRDRAAIVAGLADATMSHDDTWRFIVLGRSLERVDLTVRLLSTRLGDAWGTAGWVATLRCCAAYESYLRTYRRGVDGSKALGVPSPRPALPAFGVPRARRRGDGVVRSRPGSGSARHRQRAETIVGRACADLEFVRVAELERRVARAPGSARTRGRAQAHDATAKRFFQAAARDPMERVVTWRMAIEHVTSYEYEGRRAARRTTKRGSARRATPARWSSTIASR